MALAAILFCVAGTSLSFSLFGVLRKAKGSRRVHWLLISSIVSAGSTWTTLFLLQIAHLGGFTVAFDATILVTTAILILGARFVAFALNQQFTTRPATILSRLILSASFVALPYFQLSAFLDLSVPETTLVPAFLTGTFFTYLLIARLGAAIRSSITRRQGFLWSLKFAALTGVIHLATIKIVHDHIGEHIVHQRLDLANAQLVAPVLFVMFLVSTIGASTFFLDRASVADSLERFRRLAMHDSLTGLKNRFSMQLTLDEMVMGDVNGPAPFAIAVIDLDRFKDVNDVHGHAAGDALLKGLAQHITSGLNDGETLYRTGGDEFVAVKSGIDDQDIAAAFGQSLCAAVDSFDAWMTGNVRVGASVGLCLCPRDGVTTGDLLSRADLAMYRAKALGRGQVSIFDPAMDEARRRKTALSMDLRSAIDADELEIFWQPQVDAKTSKLLGFEALLRWEHQDRGTVPPSEFIPLAEQTGQIVDIGKWVLENACREAATWKRPYRIAVNVAAGQLNQSDLPATVTEVLAQTGLSPARLELEITETGIIQDTKKAFQTVSAIKAMGVSIAMDDFGTGYSSLSTLQTFPFDKLKIDRAFIAAMGQSPSADVIVEATIQIAHAMGLKVLAEGVETLDQVKQLQSISCHELQGYYFSKPVSTDVAVRSYGLMDSTLDQFDADTADELQPHYLRKTGR